MRHRKAGRQLGRNSAHRKAMWRNMVTSLIEHGRIRTTEAKAKELRGFAEKTITKAIRVADIVAKDADDRSMEEKTRLVHAVRVAGRMVRGRDQLHKLFHEVAPQLTSRPGGYTRITKVGPRPGDAAPMAYVEIIFDN
ncbi:MAG: 50S ribosomal protein L17 [Nannocystales bacterium]